MTLEELYELLGEFSFRTDEVEIQIGNDKFKLSSAYLEAYNGKYKIVIEGEVQ
jgi:hypothetical protein